MKAAEPPGKDAALAEGSRLVETSRLRGGRLEAQPDRVAHEEPLEIQIGGAPIAVVMRTPGHDLELVTGFLRTEGILEDLGQVASVHHASRDADAENVVRVSLCEGHGFDPRSLQRNLYASSSCGVCGKASREAALRVAPAVRDDSVFEAAFFLGLPERLRAAQIVFGETGGLHGAALFDPKGRLLVVREDVGRHNAVDKVVGWATRTGTDELRGHSLLVSGRVSFEIVQKALAAGIPAVAAVSAPTSLAVDLACEGRILLIGFLRGGEFNAYGARNRLRGAD